MSSDEKRNLVERLQKEIQLTESDYKGENDYQGSEFDNPFGTSPPSPLGKTSIGGVEHEPALCPDTYTAVTLKDWHYIADQLAFFTFVFPQATDHSGCLPGQYIAIKAPSLNGSKSDRYFSPVSPPDQYGSIEIITKFESIGKFSEYLQGLKPGEYCIIMHSNISYCIG